MALKYAAALAYTKPADYVPIAQACEAAGIWGVTCSDHLIYPKDLDSKYPYSADGAPPFTADTDWVEPLAAIGAMAGATRELHFFTNVMILPLRQPVALAKQLGSLAAVSGDRVALGVGMGWMHEEFAAVGESPSRRGARSEEAIEIIRGLTSAHDWYEFSGDFYRVAPARMRPVPGKVPPILIGGLSDVAIERAARIGDGWISDMRSTDELRVLIDRINELRGLSGRLDHDFEFVVSCSDRWTPEGFSELEDIGVTTLVTMPWAYTQGRTTDLDLRLRGIDEFATNFLV